MIILIDDLRSFKPEYLQDNTMTCRNSEVGIGVLKSVVKRDEVIEELWLDHDLGGDDTIRPVVDWIEKHKPRIQRVYIHTSNPVGRNYIRQVLWNYDTYVIPAGGFLTADYNN